MNKPPIADVIPPVDSAASYVVTLQLDPVSFERAQVLRERHFPAALNYLPAHLTLLHTVSPKQVERIHAVRPLFEHVRPPLLKFAGLRFLGNGVAIVVESNELTALRALLMGEMGGAFTRQDQQPFRAHVTIQKKAAPEEAKLLFKQLEEKFNPWQGAGEGLLVWRYLGGPWDLATELPFKRP